MFKIGATIWLTVTKVINRDLIKPKANYISLLYRTKKYVKGRLVDQHGRRGISNHKFNLIIMILKIWYFGLWFWNMAPYIKGGMQAKGI